VKDKLSNEDKLRPIKGPPNDRLKVVKILDSVYQSSLGAGRGSGSKTVQFGSYMLKEELTLSEKQKKVQDLARRADPSRAGGNPELRSSVTQSDPCAGST